MPNSRFCSIAGLPIDEHTLPEVRAKIQQENLNVRYLGQRNDVHALMQACGVLVLPSHEGVEGLPRVMVEAMTCGTVRAWHRYFRFARSTCQWKWRDGARKIT